MEATKHLDASGNLTQAEQACRDWFDRIMRANAEIPRVSTTLYEFTALRLEELAQDLVDLAETWVVDEKVPHG